MVAEGGIAVAPLKVRTGGGRTVVAVLALAASAVWLLAFSSFFAIWLFEHGAMPEWMRALTQARGSLRLWQSLAALAGLALLTATAALARYRRVLVPLGVVAGLVGLAAVAAGPDASVRTRFDLHETRPRSRRRDRPLLLARRTASRL